MTEHATIAVPADLVADLLAYLRGRPYAEVAGGVQRLEAAIAAQAEAQKTED